MILTKAEEENHTVSSFFTSTFLPFLPTKHILDQWLLLISMPTPLPCYFWVGLSGYVTPGFGSPVSLLHQRPVLKLTWLETGLSQQPPPTPPTPCRGSFQMPPAALLLRTAHYPGLGIRFLRANWFSQRCIPGPSLISAFPSIFKVISVTWWQFIIIFLFGGILLASPQGWELTGCPTPCLASGPSHSTL